MNITQDSWNSFKLKALVFSAVGGAIVSIFFNWLGFRSEAGGEWYFVLISTFFSILITIQEVYLNGRKMGEIYAQTEVWEWILTLGGVLSYVYGTYTNIIGMSLMMLHSSDLAKIGHQNWMLLIIPVTFGALLEVLPEPMWLAWMRSRNGHSKHTETHAQEEAEPEEPQSQHERDEQKHRERMRRQHERRSMPIAQTSHSGNTPIERIRRSNPATR